MIVYSTKTHNTSINVTGWKRVVNQDDGKIQVYCNGETCQFSCQGTQTIRANGTTTLGTIPSQYSPQYIVTIPVHFQANNILCRITETGVVEVHNNSSATNILMRVLVTYSLKSKII
ncbi:MAG: hypothetical protein IKF79_02220 [Methanosphaera sp.]|nr:hypothetical protein [Methanosphaera sp.]